MYAPQFLTGPMDLSIFFASTYYCLVFILLITIFYLYYRQWKDLPPGPFGLPIVGYAPFVTKLPHFKFKELGKQYGDVISMKLGSITFVVLNSAEVIREAFSKSELMARPDQKDFIAVPIRSPIFDKGDVWVQHRRFLAKFFKDNDAGSTRESVVKAEIEIVLKTLEDQDSKPFDLRHHAYAGTFSYISALMLGRRFESNDSKVTFLANLIHEVEHHMIYGSALVLFPWLKKIGITRKLLHVDELFKSHNDALQLIWDTIEDHKKSAVKTNDFIDYYLSELSSVNKTNSTFSENHISDMIQAICATGSEPVRSSVIWHCYTLAVYQDIQDKIHKEIDEVIGNNRSPSFSDQKSMPYTHATIMELQRWQSIAPLGAPRIALEDTVIAGYRIPKGTWLLSNIWAAHRHPKCWDDPDEFIPERFLSKDGTQVIKNENYIPFSIGKRDCPGERVALVQIFLYLTSILQRFQLNLPENANKPDFQGELSVAYKLKPKKVCFVPRVVEVM